MDDTSNKSVLCRMMRLLCNYCTQNKTTTAYHKVMIVLTFIRMNPNDRHSSTELMAHDSEGKVCSNCPNKSRVIRVKNTYQE